jgi:hypothetical protein
MAAQLVFWLNVRRVFDLLVREGGRAIEKQEDAHLKRRHIELVLLISKCGPQIRSALVYSYRQIVAVSATVDYTHHRCLPGQTSVFGKLLLVEIFEFLAATLDFCREVACK